SIRRGGRSRASGSRNRRRALVDTDQMPIASMADSRALPAGNARLGLEPQPKLASNFTRIHTIQGPGMTYCCGILVREGLVMIADTRTNAGLDNVSTFRKLHIFSDPGERILAIASAGNLAISQSVLSTLTEGFEDPETGEVETLMNAPTMFQG